MKAGSPGFGHRLERRRRIQKTDEPQRRNQDLKTDRCGLPRDQSHWVRRRPLALEIVLTPRVKGLFAAFN